MKLFSFSYEFVPRPDSRQSKLAATVIEYGNKTKWRVVGRAPSAPAAEPWEATFFFWTIVTHGPCGSHVGMHPNGPFELGSAMWAYPAAAAAEILPCHVDAM